MTMTNVVKKPRVLKNPPQLGTCEVHGENVLFYSKQNGSRDSCIDCKKDTYLAIAPSHKERALYPKTTTCEWHPTCTSWNTSGNNCSDCTGESSRVNNATDQDLKKGLVCTMTREYVRANIGSTCALCGYGPLIIQLEAGHPRQLSFDRVDNSKPHDCDPAQTQPVCNQCNKGKWIYTIDQFYTFMYAVVLAISDGSFADVPCDIATSLEDETLISKRLGRKDWMRTVDRQKRPREQEDIVEFTLTYDDVVKQLREQKHCCSLCHLALSVEDCSFDQTVAKNGYVAGKFTFMHRGCNSLKGEWPIEVAIETAHRAVTYRKSKME